jgi:AcrR family transcriptional regulator
MSEVLTAPNHPFFRSHARKRQAILDAAKRVFVRDGVAAASIDAIAVEAGVSRQTIYNQVGDKERLFAAAVEDVTARSSAHLFAVLDSFPDKPQDLQADLIAFAKQLITRCICDADGRALVNLMRNEAHKYPELFETWKEYGPGKTWPAISSRFAKLAYDGYLDLDDPTVAARQFMGLINADLPTDRPCNSPPTDEEVDYAACNAVTTFLRAFGPREAYPACVETAMQKRLERLRERQGEA